MLTMTTEKFNFITRDEFNAHNYRVDQKFDDLTDIMLGEFDKVIKRLDSHDQKFEIMDNKFNLVIERLDTQSKQLVEHDRMFDIINTKLDAIIAK